MDDKRQRAFDLAISALRYCRRLCQTKDPEAYAQSISLLTEERDQPPGTVAEARFQLDDGAGRRTQDIVVVSRGTYLNVLPEGYADHPVSLDYHSGTLRAVVHHDPSEDEPDIFSLEPMRAAG